MAAANVRPVTAGTVAVSPKQPDQVTPIGVRVATVAPGFKGTAPTRTSGAVPGIASDETTLWLASVPLLHGVVRETNVNPASRRAARAAAIFSPITFGTVLCGRVVVGAVTAVDDVGAAAVVVVVLGMARTAFFCARGRAPTACRQETRRHEGGGAQSGGSTPDVHGPIIVRGSSGRGVDAARACHFKMLTARATTRIATTREMAASDIIMSFIQGLTAETSVGLKAVAVAKAKWK